MRRRKLKALWRRLPEWRQMKHLNRDELLMKLGAARQQWPTAWRLVAIRVPKEDEAINPQTFTWRFSGSDNRTPQGEGNIQMVAGSIRFSTGRGTLTPHVNGMQLAFAPVPEPGLIGLLAAGGLLVVGVTRRR